ncbi:MAG: elongation factor G [Candidatus Tectomicrobia bacterium]|nr:elongation factor G [Candidatus Tectomicrobia bacterium]
MKTYAINLLRNVGLIGHGGVGKTSLAEAMLFVAGATKRLGKVDNGSSIFDYEPEEIERQFSINAMIGFCEWNKLKINVIDTPGYSNFTADTRGCMRVMDGAVVVISAEDGVQVQTEKVWKWADESAIRRLVFINAMEKERADFAAALDSADQVLAPKAVAIQVPVGSGAGFRGVVDVIREKAYLFAEDGSGKMERAEVPKDLSDVVAEAREKLMEAAAEGEDKLLEKYLESGALSTEEILQGLAAGVREGRVVPALCGSAAKVMGVQPLLDAIAELLPSPVDRPPVTAKTPSNKDPVTVQPDAEGPLAALVFKTVSDPYAGRLTFFRLFSGRLASDSSVFNGAQDERERVGQLYHIQGKEQIPVDAVSAGDFGAVAKLKVTKTGDTLCDEKSPRVFDPIEFPKPAISFAVVPKAKGDEEKISTAIQRLMEEDATLQLSRDPQTKEMILSGLGDLHLEVAMGKMRRKFGVEVEIKAPRVPYKETVRASAKAQGKYKKQTGGRGQYGDAWIEISPLARGKGFEFVNNIVGGVIPRQFIPAVEKGIIETMETGPVAGYPVTDVQARLYDGSFHTVDSSEMAFKIAGSMAFKKAFLEARPVLLEPIMNMEISVPSDLVGDVIGDLNSRRGKVLGMKPMGAHQVIQAQAPFAEVLTYAITLRSITADRGSFTMEFSHYEEVPAQMAEKVIAGATVGAKEE